MAGGRRVRRDRKSRVRTGIGISAVVAMGACGPAPDVEEQPGQAAVPVASAPSFDCADAESSAEQLICEDTALIRLDLRLDSIFALAAIRAEAMPGGSPSAISELRAVQRGWIAGRDDCWKADDLRACVLAEYRGRTAELEVDFALRPAGPTTFWTCEGDPANEFVTTTYDTDPPGIRVERGDQSVTALLTPSASGSRYEASFGRSFWIKGAEALAEWPEGTSWSCVAREVD